MKIFKFSLPVRGNEEYSIPANSIEEAIEKLQNGEYEDFRTCTEVDFDQVPFDCIESMKDYCDGES